MKKGLKIKNGIYRRLTAILLLLVFSFNIFGNNVAVDPVSIGTRATKTASGIDQIDIARPNERGTSYNRLSELQVSEQGLILNNNKYIVVDTEIAGLVARNRNLDNGQEANLIITEVTGKNQTNINGYIEVAGKRADIVIANRNGIIVNGGGFLNISGATLTTGSLQMKNGDLVSIDIEEGMVKIGEKGVDASYLDYFEILSKTADIAGIIKGGETTKILISTGSQVYEYKTKKVESKGRTYEGVAVDGKAAGSMYAGKIDIISNDKGAGVNTKGDLVSVDDITITANGDITTGKVESTRKVAYTSTKKVRTTKTVSAGTKVVVKAKEAEIDAQIITGYLTKATEEKTLEIEAEKVENKGEIQSVGKIDIRAEKMGNSGEIYAQESIDIASKETVNNGIISSEKVNITGKSLDNSRGELTAKTLGLGVEDINNSKGLIASEKEISYTGKRLDNTEGKILSDNEIALGVENIVNTKGIISGSKIEIQGKSVDNTEGLILSSNSINIESEKTDNTKGQIAGQRVEIAGKELINKEGYVQGDDLNLDTVKLDNERGILLAGDIKISARDLSNIEGHIQGSVLDLNIGNSLDNTKGLIYGEESINITAKVLKNIEGQLLANGELKISGTKEIDNTKGIISGDLEELKGERLVNAEGEILTNRSLDIEVNIISNKGGEVYSAVRVKAAGEILENINGKIHSAGQIELAISKTDNTKGKILANGIQEEDLDKKEEADKSDIAEKSEDSKETKEKEISIKITGEELNNTEGLIAGLGNIEIGAGVVNNTQGKITGDSIVIEGSKLINTEGQLTGNKEIALGIGNVVNIRGMISGDKISLKGRNLDNTEGQLVSNDLILDTAINNTKGLVLSNTIKLSGKELINKEGSIKGSEIVSGMEKLDNSLGKIEGLGKVEIVNLINNGGKVNSDYYINIRNEGNLENKGGEIKVSEKEGGVEISLGSDIQNESGQILSEGVVLINSLGDLTLEGRIEGQDGTKIEGNSLITREDINNKSILELIGRNGVILNNEVSAKILSITSGSALEINKNLRGSEGLSIEAGDVTNRSEINSGDYLYIKSAGTLKNTEQGLIYSTGDQILEGRVIENNRGRILSEGSLSLIGDTLVKNKTGSIHSNGDMYIQVANGNFENIGYTEQIIEEVTRKEKVILPDSTGKLKGSGSRFTKTIEVEVKENITKLGRTESAELTSGGNITITGKDIYNTEGSRISGTGEVYIQGENLSNTSSAQRIGSEVSLARGSVIEGKEVSLNMTGRVINGFNDLGGTERKPDGVLIDHRYGAQTELSGISGSNGTYILSRDFENRGIIGSGGTTYIESKNRVINENTGTLNTGRIYGHDILIEGKNDIINGGGIIKAGNALQMISLDGNILNETSIYSHITYQTAETEYSFLKSRTVRDKLEVNTVTEGLVNTGRLEAGGQAYLEGKSIRNMSGYIAGGEQTYLKAGEDIEDRSVSLRTRAKNVEENGKKWDVVDRTTNVSGQIGNGGDTVLIADRDISLINSDIRAGNDIVLNAKRYISSLAVVDTEYKHAQTSETKKKSWGRKATTTKTWIENNEYANGTEMHAGRHILMNYVGSGTGETDIKTLENQGIFLQGADLYSQGEIIAMSQGSIYIQGTRDTLGNFYEEKTSKSIFGINYSKSRDTLEESQERYKLVQMYGGAGLSYDSEGKLIVEGADIQTAGSIYLRGKQGVYLLPGTEEGYRREEHVKEGITTNFSMGRSSINAGVGYEKSKDTLTEVTTNIVNNQIYAGGDYYVKSEAGDYNHIATNLMAKGNMRVDAGNINILDAHAYRKIHQVSERSYAGIGVTVGVPILESAYQIRDSYKAVESSENKEGYINSGFGTLNTYYGTKAALAGVLQNPISASASLTINYSRSEMTREENISIGSNILVGGSAELNGENLHMRGSGLSVNENLVYNITNDIIIEAGKSTLEQTGSSKSYGIALSGSMIPGGSSVDGKGRINPFQNGTVLTPSAGIQSSSASGEYYTSSQISVKGNTDYNVGGNATIRGGNVETGSISGKIEGNLTIESVQNKLESESQGYSGSYGVGLGSHIVKDEEGLKSKNGAYTSSIGAGYNEGKSEQQVTVSPSSFTAGAGEVAAGGVKQAGSLIDGDFTIDTKNYEWSDLKDTNKSYQIGGNITVYPGAVYTERDKNGNKVMENGAYKYNIGTTEKIGIMFGFTDKARDIKATVGEGVRVTTDISGVNRDKDSQTGEYTGVQIDIISVDLSSEYWLTKAGRGKDSDLTTDALRNVKGIKNILTKRDAETGELNILKNISSERFVLGLEKIGFLDTKEKTQKQVSDEVKARFSGVTGKEVNAKYYDKSDLAGAPDDETTKNKLEADGFAVTKDGSIWINKEWTDSGKTINFNTLTGHELAHLKFGVNSEYEARYVESGYEEYLTGVEKTGYLRDSDGITDWQYSILTDEDRTNLQNYSLSDMEFRHMSGDDYIDNRVHLDFNKPKMVTNKNLNKLDKVQRVVNKRNQAEKDGKTTKQIAKIVKKEEKEIEAEEIKENTRVVSKAEYERLKEQEEKGKGLTVLGKLLEGDPYNSYKVEVLDSDGNFYYVKESLGQHIGGDLNNFVKDVKSGTNYLVQNSYYTTTGAKSITVGIGSTKEEAYGNYYENLEVNAKINGRMMEYAGYGSACAGGMVVSCGIAVNDVISDTTRLNGSRVDPLKDTLGYGIGLVVKDEETARMYTEYANLTTRLVLGSVAYSNKTQVLSNGSVLTTKFQGAAGIYNTVKMQTNGAATIGQSQTSYFGIVNTVKTGAMCGNQFIGQQNVINVLGNPVSTSYIYGDMTGKMIVPSQGMASNVPTIALKPYMNQAMLGGAINTNGGLLGYTANEVRPSMIYVGTPTGEIIPHQNGLSGWKPTVLGSNPEVIIMPDFPTYSSVVIGGGKALIENVHTVFPEIKYGRGGVKGSHNEANFNNFIMDNDIRMRVVSTVEHPTIDGIFKINYQIARKDPQNMGVFLEPSQYNPNMSNPPTKTLYDPSIITNKQMIDWAIEASQNAIQLKNPRTYKGIAQNGLEFMFNDQQDGTFRYYPQIP